MPLLYPLKRVGEGCYMIITYFICTKNNLLNYTLYTEKGLFLIHADGALFSVLFLHFTCANSNFS